MKRVTLTQEQQREAAANAFAMALLMPEKAVRAYMDKYPDFDLLDEIHVRKMAQHFQVPEIIIPLRLMELGYIAC